MKKISFSERYGMQQAVLDGTKTMTRRIVPDGTLRMAQMEVSIHGGDLADRIKDHSLYLWRDEVAVAQRYEEAIHPCDWVNKELYEDEPGWKNKMFVRADLMPHRIRFTDIRVERLQDISDEDCLKEGITTITEGKNEVGNAYGWDTKIDALKRDSFFTPRAAFAALIDRICGRGTWQRNPWVFVYSFEIAK